MNTQSPLKSLLAWTLLGTVVLGACLAVAQQLNPPPTAPGRATVPIPAGPAPRVPAAARVATPAPAPAVVPPVTVSADPAAAPAVAPVPAAEAPAPAASLPPETNAPVTPGTAPAENAAPAAPGATVPVVPAKPHAPGGLIMLNFQGAALKDVLNYLSDAAGFVIVQDVPVTGTVNVISRQPMGAEDAVDLLNTVLADKGYTAIRNGRVLKIISRKDAPKSDIPVQMVPDATQIDHNDKVVTQIIPLRFGEAAKVIENLRPLLPDSATISANESSNAIIMTDTQTNIRRIALILHALDTSVSNISSITVFPLEFADSKAVAETVTQLFPATQQPQAANQRGGGRFGGFPGFGGGGGFGRGGGGGGGGGAAESNQSEARLAAVRVIAVADEQSNSVIVSAPDELLPVIRQVITQIDTSISDVLQTHVFTLKNADAVELADILTNLYSDSSGQRSTASRTGTNGRRGGQAGGGGAQGGGATASQQSQRALLQAKVVAVGDPRTNILVVTAAVDTMGEIEEVVTKLDSTQAKNQHVYVHHMKFADAENVADVLRGMLGDNSASSAAQQQSRVNQRISTGAADTSSSQNQGVGSSSGGRGTR